MARTVLDTRIVTLNKTKIKIYPCGVTFWYIQTNTCIALRQGLAYSRDSKNIYLLSPPTRCNFLVRGKGGAPLELPNL